MQNRRILEPQFLMPQVLPSMPKTFQKSLKCVPKVSQMCSKSDAKSWSVRKMHNVISTALCCVENTFATTPELQNHFRNRWKFQAFSKSLQIRSKYPKSVLKQARWLEIWTPMASQNVIKFLENRTGSASAAGHLQKLPPAVPDAPKWRPRCIEGSQMLPKMFKNCSPDAVLERRRAEERKSRTVFFDMCRSSLATHRIIHSSSSGEVGGRGGSL